jgi:hypothetical protein
VKGYDKTDRSRRAVPLTDRALAALNVIPPSLLTPLVFPTFSGGFRNGAGIGVPGFLNLRNWRKRHWTPALRAAGLERDGKPWLPVPYVLRHTFATWALEAIEAVGSDEAIDTSLALVADRDRIVTLVAAREASSWASRFLAAHPGPTPEPRSGAQPRSSSPGSPKRAISASLSPRATRSPKPPPPTEHSRPATPTARSSSFPKAHTPIQAVTHTPSAGCSSRLPLGHVPEQAQGDTAVFAGQQLQTNEHELRFGKRRWLVFRLPASMPAQGCMLEPLGGEAGEQVAASSATMTKSGERAAACALGA